MEKFKELEWSWKILRSPEDGLNYFNETFAQHHKDALKNYLNEIDPNLQTDVNMKFGDDVETSKDPRTKSEITNIILDQTSQGRHTTRTTLFKNFPRKSKLTKQEHMTCLRVLKGFQTKAKVSDTDIQTFTKTDEMRQEEYKLYMNFVKDYKLGNRITPSEKKINELYKSYLEERTKYMLSRPNKTYDIVTAMCLPSHVKTESQATLNDSEIVLMNGYIPKNENSINFHKLKCDLDKLLKRVSFDENNRNPPNLRNRFEKLENDYDVFITEEIMNLLMGSCEDLTGGWEICVQVVNRDSVEEDMDRKFLEFTEILPLRCVNYHTNALIIEKLFNSFLNYSTTVSWLKILNNGNLIDIPEEELEIQAGLSNMPYTLKEIDNKFTESNNFIELKSNEAFVQCELSNNTTGDSTNLLVQTKLGFCLEKETPCFLNLSLKLEYNKELGAEIMTKSELLKEWIRLLLIPNSTTKRNRIDVCTLDLLQFENISLTNIENDFERSHKTCPLNTLASLQEFFKMLLRFPCGNYLLKYDPKYREKIMVYKETTDSAPTKTTFSIHDIYSNIMKNSNFSENCETLTIDREVALPMHFRHKILPGCFPHWGTDKKPLFNDRDFILHNAIIKQRLVQKNNLFKKTSAKRLKNKKKKRIRQRKLSLIVKQEKLDENKSKDSDMQMQDQNLNTKIETEEDVWTVKNILDSNEPAEKMIVASTSHPCLKNTSYNLRSKNK